MAAEEARPPNAELEAPPKGLSVEPPVPVPMALVELKGDLF